MKLGELGKEPSTCFPACGPNLAHFYLRRYEIGAGKRISQHLSGARYPVPCERQFIVNYGLNRIAHIDLPLDAA